MEKQKTLNNKTLQRKKSKAEGIPLSDFDSVTKLQWSEQYGTGIKTDILEKGAEGRAQK